MKISPSHVNVKKKKFFYIKLFYVPKEKQISEKYALFSIFVNLCNVCLQVAGFLYLPLYSICCSIMYHVASYWKFYCMYVKQ